MVKPAAMVASMSSDRLEVVGVCAEAVAPALLEHARRWPCPSLRSGVRPVRVISRIDCCAKNGAEASAAHRADVRRRRQCPAGRPVPMAACTPITCGAVERQVLAQRGGVLVIEIAALERQRPPADLHAGLLAAEVRDRGRRRSSSTTDTAASPSRAAPGSRRLRRRRRWSADRPPSRWRRDRRQSYAHPLPRAEG